MTSLCNNVKFSYNLIKGSVRQRKKFVSQTNEKMFEAFYTELKNNCSFSKFKKVYARTIPEYKEVKISKFQEDKYACAAQDYIYDENKGILGLTLEIPTQKPKNIFKQILKTILNPRYTEISKEKLIDIMHENTHVLDTLANPKQTALTQKLYLGGKYNKRRNKLYDYSLYKKEGMCVQKIKPKKVLGRVKKETMKFLADKSVEEQIAHLQDMRYQLEQERHAYAEERKYAEILKSRGEKVLPCYLQDCDKLYLFTEKIEFLKSLAFKLIKKERMRLAKQYTN